MRLCGHGERASVRVLLWLTTSWLSASLLEAHCQSLCYLLVSISSYYERYSFIVISFLVFVLFYRALFVRDGDKNVEEQALNLLNNELRGTDYILKCLQTEANVSQSFVFASPPLILFDMSHLIFGFALFLYDVVWHHGRPSGYPTPLTQVSLALLSFNS